MGFAQSIKDRIAWFLPSPYVPPAAVPPPAAPAKAEPEPATPRKRGRPRAVKLANDLGAAAAKKPRGRPRRAAAPAVAVPLPNGNGVLLLPYKPSSPPLPDAESA
jgi:hypothetical protein